MKKLILGMAVALTASVALSNNENVITLTESKGGKVTLINDTDDKVKIHTGTGSVTLNPNGGKTSFSCDTGKKVKADGDVIFTNDSDFCGETVKLSDYL